MINLENSAGVTAARKVRTGIVGTGFISSFHLRAACEVPDVSVECVCDTDLAKAEAFAHTWGIPRAYGSFAEMARQEQPNVVHVLVPPRYHFQTALECLEAGCDVFLEKPVAVDLAEALELEHRANRLGRVAAVNHNAVFHPAFVRLVSAIQDWKLGGVQHVIACLNVPLRQLSSGQHGHWMFQEPGNIILEQGPHPLSQIEFLLGAPLAATAIVSGERVLNTGKAFYGTWQISLIHERGTAQCYFSFGREYMDSSLHVIGQDGAAHLDLRRNTISFHGKSQYLEPVDNMHNSVGSGLAATGQGLTNLLDYGLGFLKLRPAKDAFYQGMKGSISSFYEAYRAGSPPVVGLRRGCAVIDA